MELYGEFASRIVALDHGLVLDILRDLPTDAPAPAILVYKRGAGYLAPIEWPPTERTPSVGTVFSLPSE